MSQPQYSEPKEDEATMKQPEKIVPLQNPTTEAREGCDNQIESDLHKISNLLQKMHDRTIDKFDDVSKVSGFKILVKKKRRPLLIIFFPYRS